MWLPFFVYLLSEMNSPSHMCRKKSKIKKQREAEEREKRKKDGYYDGRFKTKVVPNKKKKIPKKKPDLGNEDL